MKRISLLLAGGFVLVLASSLNTVCYHGHYYNRHHSHGGEVAAGFGGFALGTMVGAAAASDSDVDPVAREEARMMRDERKEMHAEKRARRKRERTEAKAQRRRRMRERHRRRDESDELRKLRKRNAELMSQIADLTRTIRDLTTEVRALRK